MANEIITTLHPDQDTDTNLYPNIKKENIPNKSIDTTKLDNAIVSLLNSINELHPSGTDTSTNILAFTSNKGIYVGTDNGHWYYWDGTQYIDGGQYLVSTLDDYLSINNTTGIQNKVITSALLNTTYSENMTITFREYGYISKTTLTIQGASARTYAFSEPILVEYGKKYVFMSNNYNGVSAITETTSGGTFISCLNVGLSGTDFIQFTPSKDMYITLCWNVSVNPLFIKCLDGFTDYVDNALTNYKIIRNELLKNNNITPINITFTKGYFINTSDTIVVDSSGVWGYSQVIELNFGETLHIIGTGYINGNSMISVCDSDGTNIKSTIIATSSNIEHYKFYARKNTDYVIISCKCYLPYIVYKTNSNTDLELYEKSHFTDYDDINLGTINLGFITNNSTHTINNVNTTFSYSEPFYVTKGKTISISSRGYESTIASLVSCESDGTINDTLLVVGSTYNTLEYEVTTSGYFRICWHNQYKLIALTFTNIVHQEDYVGKTWAVFGDSLTEKNYRAVTSYYDYIAHDLNISIVNYGQSGTGYKRSGSNFMNRMLNINPNAFDILTIFGSFNDINPEEAYVLGTASDNTTDTLGGCINITIDNFYTMKPLGKIGLITPTPWAEYYSTSLVNSTSMENYANLIVEIGKRRGIPVLDLYHCSGLRPWNNDVLLAYYNENGVQDTGVHPNSVGHKFISPMIKEFIKSLLETDYN